MDVNRKELLAALEPLKPAVANRAIVDELSHIWFDGKYAYSSNGGMGIRVKLETPFKLGVSGSLLLGLLNQATADSLTFKETGDNLTLKAGRSTTKLVTMDLERRPWAYPDKFGQSMAVLKLTKEVMAAFKRVFVLKPSNPQRAEHYGVVIFPLKKEIEIYTTDSKGVAFMPVGEPMQGELKNTIIPRTFAEQMIAQSKYDVELRMYKRCFVVEADDNVTLYSNVLDTSEMIDLPAVLSNRAPPDVKPLKLPEGFREPLERAVLMSGSDSAVVTLDLTKSGLTLKGKYRFGELEETFKIKHAGEEKSTQLLADKILALKDVNEILLMETSATFYGEDNFIFVMASWEDPKKVKKTKKSTAVVEEKEEAEADA